MINLMLVLALLSMGFVVASLCLLFFVAWLGGPREDGANSLDQDRPSTGTRTRTG